MRCFFCNSDDLKVTNTYSNNESITVSQFVTKHLEGKMSEVVQQPVTISATRRKVKCNHCGRYFWTVEHFESSTKRTDIQQQVCANLFMIGDIATELPQSDLSAEEKERITKLIQEEL